MKQITKKYLDELVIAYETPDFIKDDPVQFPHRYSYQQDVEVSALISSCLAYGNRKKIIETLDYIHKIINGSPAEFAINFHIDRDAGLFKGFIYRYNQERDIVQLFHIIGQALREHETLEKAFLKGYKPDENNIKQSLTCFVNLLRGYLPCTEERCKGLYHLLPDPAGGSACKRLNLFLKWMVRKGAVDLNVWKSIPESKLIIPLDTHVARISRKWGLTSRKTDDWKTAEEITENLKKFDSDDPVRYDFALFGMGIAGLA